MTSVGAMCRSHLRSGLGFTMIDEARFDQLLGLPEGQYLEFKQSVSGSLGKEICSFANASGGTIIVGAQPGGPIVGITDPSGDAAMAQNMARSCNPSVSIQVVHFRREGKALLAIEVPGSQDQPHCFGSTFYMRVGATAQSMNRDEIIDFLYSSGQVRYEERPNREFRFPADFAGRTFSRYLLKAKMSRPRRIADALVNLGIARREEERIV